MRLLLVSDLHGSDVVFRKLSNALKVYKVDAVVLAGDLSGKALAPVVRLRNGKFKIPYLDGKREFTEDEARAKVKELRDMGIHVAYVDEDEYGRMISDKAYTEGVFLKVLQEDVGRMLNMIDERYRQYGVKLYVIPGNDDPQPIADLINKGGWSNIVPSDEKAVDIGGYQLVGFGYSNPTPWNTPRELSEDEIYRRVSRILNGLNPAKTILMIHAPPFNTLIDQAPQLTKDLKPIVRGGEVLMTHVGSSAVRRIIEEFRPIMGLHGHIHESGGVDYIKADGKVKIPVFNAGSEYQYGILRGILISVDEGKVTYLPVRG